MRTKKVRQPDHKWSDRLHQAFLESGFNRQIDLARASGVGKGTLSKYMAGRTTEPEYTQIRALCEALGVDVDFILFGGPEPMSVKPRNGNLTARQQGVPVVGIAQMGEGGYWDELGMPAGQGDEYLSVVTGDENAYALQVRGDSMHPAIRDGWYVVVEPNREPEPGEFVVVRTTSGQSMVKELLWSRRGQVALSSINEDHPRLTLHEEEIAIMHAVTSVASPAAVKPA